MNRNRKRRSMASRRRGLSLMVVMVTISASLVVTMSFVQTQTTLMQLDANADRRGRALEAARAGAAAALRHITSTDWPGSAAGLERTVTTDRDGRTSYTVTFSPVEPSQGESPAAAALSLAIRSTGRWEAELSDGTQIEREVELLVRLAPRITREGTNGSEPTDEAANPGDYDEIQQYAMFAERGRTSLVLDPCDRIDGPVWLRERLQLYRDPAWRDSVRDTLLDSIGSRYVSGGGAVHPHPLAGPITFGSWPNSDTRADLSRLKVPWTRTTRVPALPQPSFSTWQTYRLYEGGYEYRAQQVSRVLKRVTLRATVDNPLGIFYRSGDIRVDDDVVIEGTLVSSGEIELDGEDVHLAACDWRDSTGESIFAGAESWPRLPAIVADEVTADRSLRATVEGAIVTRQGLSGAGGDYELLRVPHVELNGTATSRPAGQPYSVVRFASSVDLSPIGSGAGYAIWLADGPTGSWHPIVAVNREARELTVLGESNHEQSVACRLLPLRESYLDIRGPVCGRQHEINRPDCWVLNRSKWDERREEWQQDNAWLEANRRPTIAFVDWLADARNFVGWRDPLDDHGLTLEPTFHVQRPANVRYRFSPPVFAAFDDDDRPADGGYRWEVLSWRELP
ncbi:MAG: hypothetical protein KY476_08260 [Planctomycetes bacterium]|nr:hypothetical protein [Planctomycetota bacterium]